jgi:tRNA1(Val) A37 N6-methylase TrmN6
MQFSTDAFLGGNFYAKQPLQGHRSGLDAVLLAAFCAAKEGQSVCDMGAGVGIAGLCLAARVKIKLTLLEINTELAMLAAQNAPTATLLTQDAFQRATLPANMFDHCILNPPYNPASMSPSPQSAKRLAHEGVNLEEWLKSAAHLLHAKGELTMIDRPERLPVLLAALTPRFGAIALMAVHTLPTQPATRLLIRAKKGSRAALQMLSPLTDVQRFTRQVLAIATD